MYVLQLCSSSAVSWLALLDDMGLNHPGHKMWYTEGIFPFPWWGTYPCQQDQHGFPCSFTLWPHGRRKQGRQDLAQVKKKKKRKTRSNTYLAEPQQKVIERLQLVPHAEGGGFPFRCSEDVRNHFLKPGRQGSGSSSQGGKKKKKKKEKGKSLGKGIIIKYRRYWYSGNLGT